MFLMNNKACIFFAMQISHILALPFNIDISNTRTVRSGSLPYQPITHSSNRLSERLITLHADVTSHKGTVIDLKGKDR